MERVINIKCVSHSVGDRVLRYSHIKIITVATVNMTAQLLCVRSGPGPDVLFQSSL